MKRFFYLVLIFAFSYNLYSNSNEGIIQTLKEMFIADDGVLPDVKTVKEFLDLAVERG